MRGAPGNRRPYRDNHCLEQWFLTPFLVQMCYSMGDHTFGRLTSLGNRCPTPHLWNVGSGWEDRTEEIYTLAGAVEKLAATQ